VCRLGAGATVEVFNGTGHAYRARVVNATREQVELEVVADVPDDRMPDLSLTLATAVPKGERFDWLIEKATELGVARLIPLRTARSVVDPRGSKLERLRRLSLEACKQCGRNRLMILEEPRPWSLLLDEAETENEVVRFLADPGGRPVGGTLRAPRLVDQGPGSLPSPTETGRVRLPPTGPVSRTAMLAVGPEGGFGDEEIAQAEDRGWRLLGLGRTLLRVETAGVVGSALLLNGWQGGGL
jgi:16S rRNA (uracil1498-N3)-methyltransferase